MISEQRRNRMVCNKCNHRFDIHDAVIEYKEFAGVKYREKRCPLCGGTFRAVELPDELDVYLYVDRDERYYSYPDKGGN